MDSAQAQGIYRSATGTKLKEPKPTNVEEVIPKSNSTTDNTEEVEPKIGIFDFRARRRKRVNNRLQRRIDSLAEKQKSLKEKKKSIKYNTTSRQEEKEQTIDTDTVTKDESADYNLLQRALVSTSYALQDIWARLQTWAVGDSISGSKTSYYLFDVLAQRGGDMIDHGLQICLMDEFDIVFFYLYLEKCRQEIEFEVIKLLTPKAVPELSQPFHPITKKLPFLGHLTVGFLVLDNLILDKSLTTFSMNSQDVTGCPVSNLEMEETVQIPDLVDEKIDSFYTVGDKILGVTKLETTHSEKAAVKRPKQVKRLHQRPKAKTVTLADLPDLPEQDFDSELIEYSINQPEKNIRLRVR